MGGGKDYEKGGLSEREALILSAAYRIETISGLSEKVGKGL